MVQTVCGTEGLWYRRSVVQKIGIQLREKYKENFDVSSECPSLGS